MWDEDDPIVLEPVELGSSNSFYPALSYCWVDSMNANPGCPVVRGHHNLYRRCSDAKEGFSNENEHKTKHNGLDNSCINNSNSADLSEAIKLFSLYYESATICIAFAFPMRNRHEAGQNLEEAKLRWSIKNSSWFDRGWTLQQVAVPVHIQPVNMDNGMDKNGKQRSIFSEVNVSKHGARLVIAPWHATNSSRMGNGGASRRHAMSAPTENILLDSASGEFELADSGFAKLQNTGLEGNRSLSSELNIWIVGVAGRGKTELWHFLQESWQRTLLEGILTPARMFRPQSQHLQYKKLTETFSSFHCDVGASSKHQANSNTAIYACPFAAHNQHRYRRDDSACTATQGITIENLMEHLRQVHSARERCVYCGKGWLEDEDWDAAMSEHLKLDACITPAQLISRPEFMTKDQEQACRQTDNDLRSPDEMWMIVYMRLFPGEWPLPNPRLATTTHSNVHGGAKPTGPSSGREGPRRLHIDMSVDCYTDWVKSLEQKCSGVQSVAPALPTPYCIHPSGQDPKPGYNCQHQHEQTGLSICSAVSSNTTRTYIPSSCGAIRRTTAGFITLDSTPGSCLPQLWRTRPFTRL